LSGLSFVGGFLGVWRLPVMRFSERLALATNAGQVDPGDMSRFALWPL